MEKINNSHILIIGSGPSLKKYWDKIKKFIDDNNPITCGCNYITDFIIPDYHFWGSTKRWNAYGQFYNKKSVLIVSEHFDKRILRKHWKGKYRTFKNISSS